MKTLKLSLLCTTLLSVGCAQIPVRTANLTSTPSDKNCIMRLDDRKACQHSAHYLLDLSPEKEKEKITANMFILEINDQGVMAHPEVAQQILDHLRTEMEKDHKPQVNLFVHGWNNNAKANNANLMSFERAVAALKQSNLANDSTRHADATGIYVSWRAKTLPTGAHVVTFWDRKAVSEEVGRGELASFIFELESVIKPNYSKKSKSNNQVSAHGKLILAGHSFGASALYNAVGHTLTARFYDSLEKQKIEQDQKGEGNFNQPIRGVGDIIILLNPAIEALRFRGLRESVYQRAIEDSSIFKNNKSPVMVVLASEDDIHVETAFPIGRLMGQLFTHYDQDEIGIYQPKIDVNTVDHKISFPIKTAQRQSIGFFEPYYTHYVIKSETEKKSENLLSGPKKIVTSVTDTLNEIDVIKDTGITKIINPVYISEQVTDIVKDNQGNFNFEQCLSKEAKTLHEQYKNTVQQQQYDWFDAVYNRNTNTENFYTKIKLSPKDGAEKTDLDLFTFQLSNNPSLFEEHVKDSWDLIKDKPDKPLTWKQNPYWFVKAKRDFMQGHNDIWTENVGCLLMVLMTNKSNMQPNSQAKPTSSSTEEIDQQPIHPETLLSEDKTLVNMQNTLSQ